MELAALALPAHPTPLGAVPKAPAMQQQEAIVAMDAPVQPVQARDAGNRCAKQRLVLRGRFSRRVDPIGKQREPNVAVLGGEVVNLEAAYVFIDVGGAGQ